MGQAVSSARHGAQQTVKLLDPLVPYSQDMHIQIGTDVVQKNHGRSTPPYTPWNPSPSIASGEYLQRHERLCQLL